MQEAAWAALKPFSKWLGISEARAERLYKAQAVGNRQRRGSDAQRCTDLPRSTWFAARMMINAIRYGRDHLNDIVLSVDDSVNLSVLIVYRHLEDGCPF